MQKKTYLYAKEILINGKTTTELNNKQNINNLTNLSTSKKINLKLKLLKAMEDKNKKKSFSQNAKDFLGAWGDDFAQKNKDILDRAKKRREENQKLNEQIKSLWGDIQLEFKGTAKDLYNKVNSQFQGFMQAAKKGTATIAQKIELESSIDQMKAFLQASHDKGEQEFNKRVAEIKDSLKNLNIESKDSIHQDIKNQAEEQIVKENKDQLDDLKNKANDLNNLFEKE